MAIVRFTSGFSGTSGCLGVSKIRLRNSPNHCLCLPKELGSISHQGSEEFDSQNRNPLKKYPSVYTDAFSSIENSKLVFSD